MRRCVILRMGLIVAAMILLYAPLSQALDRHDHFTPRDTELNLCVLAAVATAAYWAFGSGLPTPASRTRIRVGPDQLTRQARVFVPAPPDPTHSPPVSLRV